MDNIWIVLLAVLGIASSLYTQSRKKEKAKRDANSEPQTTKPKNIFDTIFSELNEGEDYKPEKKITRKVIPLYSDVNEYNGKDKYLFSSLSESNNTDIIKQDEIKETENSLQNEQKLFDLKEAVINSAILYRQYN